MTGSPESVDAGSFELEGVLDAAVLCLHGLTGTPYEVRTIGEACARRGISAFGPALPGHGETPEALRRVRSWRAWLEAARAHAQVLRSRHSRVFAAGLSMGGLLALALAAEDVFDALVVVGTPLRLPLGIRLVVPLAWRVRSFQQKSGGSDIQDAAARARHPSYPVLPLRSVNELIKLQRWVRARLARVRTPILVAHGALDQTAHSADARAIFEGVSSQEREFLLCNASGHVVPVDVDAPLLAEAAASFLLRHIETTQIAAPSAVNRTR
ncbi:MAG TPA: alpha/beta fold hydrolase [Myxococcota bacterium]|nr:alpha/beta fold hydrolase [Myxococcota bacterium]